MANDRKTELHEGSIWTSESMVTDRDGQVLSIDRTIDGSVCLLVGNGRDLEPEWAYVEDVHAVLERGGYCPHALKERAREKVLGHCKDCVSWKWNMNQANDPWCSDNDSWTYPADGSGFCSRFEAKP